MAEPTLRQLRYLSALAETLHFGDAAAECGVSQPALSSQIQELEKLFGRQLVERTSRKVLFTPEGVQVVNRARRVLSEYDELLALPSESDPMAGRVRLGVIPTVAPYVLPRVLPRVRELYPHLDLLLTEDLTPRLVPALAGGDLDLVLAALPLDGGFTTRRLVDEPFVLAAPRNHRLSERKSVVASDVDPAELMLLQEGHCLRTQALDYCQLDVRGHRAAVEATSLTTLVQMVAGGLGVTLMPLTATVDAPPPDEVRLVPFAGRPPARTLGLAWRTSSSRHVTFEMLAAHLEVEMKRLLDEAAF